MSEEEFGDPILVAEGGGFISVSDCGSTILYSVQNSKDYAGADFSGSVQLTDCSRMISWGFSCDESGIAKIDKTIANFQKFRVALQKGMKLQKKLDQERKKKK